MWDTFTVRFILNGIICKVGCQRIYFATPQEMCKAMEEYIEDPQASIKRWRDTAYQKISEGCGMAEVSMPSPPSEELNVRPGRAVSLAPPTPLEGRRPETFLDPGREQSRAVSSSETASSAHVSR